MVTGSNGLLGQTLTQLITSTRRAELVATSKGENRYPMQEGYVYFELDITDKDQLQKLISDVKPDTIINTAAITNVDICHVERGLCRVLNIDAVKNLSEICASSNIHLIHLSTDFVFDGADGPYSEEATPNPVSFYGETKLKAEQVLQESPCRWTILRTILVYGVTANMSRSNIVLWAKSALQKGEPIKVVTDQWRMPTLALDLAEACLLAAEKEATGLFHISGKDMMTVYELVTHVATYWDLNLDIIQPITSAELSQDAKRPGKTGFILDKANQVLGYEPHSFLEGLRIVDNELSARN